MIRSLWTAATGMQAQTLNIDVISNNLANVSTAGFKKSRADFQDLLYETLRPAGVASSESTEVPTGIQVGHGTRPSAVNACSLKAIFSRPKTTRPGHRGRRFLSDSAVERGNGTPATAPSSSTTRVASSMPTVFC